jgi:hypothetical protein
MMAPESLLNTVSRAIGLGKPRIDRARSTDGVRRAERYWTDAFANSGITTWMSEAEVRRAINERVTGCPDE